MKRQRSRILKEIGKGIVEAKRNRIRELNNPFRSQIHSSLKLKGVRIMPPEFLEEAKKSMAYDFAKSLYENNLIQWTIEDYYDPVLRGNVRIEGLLRVEKPEGR